MSAEAVIETRPLSFFLERREKEEQILIKKEKRKKRIEKKKKQEEERKNSFEERRKKRETRIAQGDLHKIYSQVINAKKSLVSARNIFEFLPKDLPIDQKEVNLLSDILDKLDQFQRGIKRLDRKVND